MSQNGLATFFKKAASIHGDKFDYSKFIYISAKTKGIIICPVHGEFLQNPDKHLNSKFGCIRCWNDYKKENSHTWVASGDQHGKNKLISFEDFLTRANKKYNNKFIYDDSLYSGICGNKIKITCPIHGDFLQSPANHLMKNLKCGCPKCGFESISIAKTKTYKDFLLVVNKIFNNKYSYPNIKNMYVNRKSIIDIQCDKHGIFKKRAQKHIIGQGCNMCRIDQLVRDNILVGGYSHDLFKNKPFLKNEKCSLYLLSINGDKFFKVGITRKSIKGRIAGIKSKAKSHGYIIKKVDVIRNIDSTLYNCFMIEQDIIMENKKFRRLLRWSTELFSVDVTKSFDKILNQRTV